MGLCLFVCGSSTWCTGTPNTPASARPPVSPTGSPWWGSSCRSVAPPFFHPQGRWLAIIFQKCENWFIFFFKKIQIGSKNESLQKVLDKFDMIKAKVGEAGLKNVKACLL